MARSRPATHAFEIGELLPDGRLWEAVGYGRILADPTSSDPWVEVAMAPLAWHKDARRPHWDGEAVIVRVGVGTLPALPLGSQWRHRQPQPPWRRAPKREFVVGHTFPPNFSVGTTIPDLASDKPALQARPLGSVADAPCYLVQFADGGSALVPALEVVRAALGPTTDFMKLVVEGYSETHPLRERWLFDIAASGWTDRDEGRFRLQALRRLRAEELRVAARAAADLDYRRAFHGVHATLVAGSQGLRYAQPPFPFAGESEWTFDETWFAIRNEQGRVRRRRLITRIHDIRYSAGVRSLAVEIPLRETLDDEDERPEPSCGSRPRRQKRPGPVIVEHSIDADIGLDHHDFALGEHDTALEFEVVERFIPVPGTASTGARSKSKAEETDRGSSGDVGAGSTPTIQTRFVDGRTMLREDVARPWPPHMLATQQALETLARADGYALTLLRPANGAGAQDGLWRYTPVVDQRPQPWTVIDGRLRRALAAVLRHPTYDVYVFETEVLPLSQEHYALGLMRIDPPRPMHVDLVPDILKALVRERGVWLRLDLNAAMGRRTRESSWDSERYARFIRATIISMATGSTSPQELSEA